MNRSAAIDRLNSEKIWDILVIGGGATGLGCALDAAARGFKTALIERSDFAQGTSSRSTKLVHGGVRYLKQGNLSLVRGALKERGLLKQNAPHLFDDQSFIIPSYNWYEKFYYGTGLTFYDALAGKLGIEKTSILSRQEALEAIPTLKTENLRGGVRYYDGQFDDARMTIALAQSIWDQGGVALNYVKAEAFIKKNGKIVGIEATDIESGESVRVHSKAVINATGVFSDSLRQLDDPASPEIIQTSQGAHIVLPKKFVPGNSAIMVPKTSDGRVLFAIPWKDSVIVGTTDTPMDKIDPNPKPLDQEIDFILENARRYLETGVDRKDIRSVYAGLRPLVKPPKSSGNTAALSRDHTIQISNTGLITIAGGKWTTFRKMGQDTIDRAIEVAGLVTKPCQTRALALHGASSNGEAIPENWRMYGSDALKLQKLASDNAELNEELHPDFSYKKAEIVFGIREEMALSIEDLLSRRTRILVQDAKAAMEAAPAVAAILAKEQGRDETWARNAVEEFKQTAREFLP